MSAAEKGAVMKSAMWPVMCLLCGLPWASHGACCRACCVRRAGEADRAGQHLYKGDVASCEKNTFTQEKVKISFSLANLNQ